MAQKSLNRMPIVGRIITERKRFIKFCIVGGSGAVIQLGLTYVLTDKAHIWYLLSLVIVIALTTIWNFWWNFSWTFRSKSEDTKNQHIK